MDGRDGAVRGRGSLLRGVAVALLVVAVAGGTADGALPCKVPASVRYTTVFRDEPATRVDDLADRVVGSFSRDDRGQPVYEEVGSKYGQPRTVPEVSSFTTPHRGTDFAPQWTNEDSDVHAVADGTLVATSAAWKMSERIDAAHYAVTMHVRPLSGFGAGRVVVVGEKVARVGSTEENGGFNEHVHFGMTVDAKGAVWRPIGPYYDGVPGWRGGRDLEFVSFARVDEANVLTLSAYTLTGGAWGEHLQACSDVTVRYRVRGRATWKEGAMEAAGTASDGTGDVTVAWRFDLGTAGKTGDTVEWYVAAYRDPDAALSDDYDMAIDAHNYGLYPARYAHPADAPGSYPAGTAPRFVATVLR
jgi:hypothetical protein